MAALTCKKCGKKNGKTAKYCKSCGSPDLAFQASESSGDPAPSKNPIDAAAAPEREFDFDIPETLGEAKPISHEAESTNAVPATDRKTSSSSDVAPHYPSFRVEVASGPDAGRSAEIHEGQTLTIGALAPADLLMPSDPHVSGRHASIKLEGGIMELSDEGSTNGTYVRIQDRIEITDGVTVILGDQTRLKVTRVK